MSDKYRLISEEVGRLEERQRIIKLLGNFWCGEPACAKHPVRMDWVISAINKDETK